MKDGETVELLRKHIETLGVDLYLAEHDPQPGMLLADKVAAEIARADAMVVFLTETGAAAPFVHQEIGAARQAGKLIVPIVQAGVSTNVLAMLTGVEYIEVDLADQAQAMATVTEKLGPFVQAQAEKLRAAQPTPAATTPTIPVPVAVGVVALVLVLLLYLDRAS
jgi:hypothetical protein